MGIHEMHEEEIEVDTAFIDIYGDFEELVARRKDNH